MRGSERPETLQEAGMDHTGTRALEDVKISTLDLGIALVDTWTTRFPKDPQVFTGAFNLTRAVGLHRVYNTCPLKVLQSENSVVKVFRLDWAVLFDVGIDCLLFSSPCLRDLT